MAIDKVAILTDIKTLYKISDTSKDPILNICINEAEEAILHYIGELEVPTPLSNVLRSVAMARYNHIGKEGVNSVNIGDSVPQFANLLDPYKDVLKRYRSAGRLKMF